jgi:putative transposase
MKVSCSRAHIVRIMQDEQLWAVHKKKFRVTTDSEHNCPIAENILARDFAASHPNEKWVSDITYIRTREGWLYLAVIIDLYSRRVVGWSMGTSLKTGIIMMALSTAIRNRKPAKGLIHHSDRGVQYHFSTPLISRQSYIQPVRYWLDKTLISNETTYSYNNTKEILRLLKDVL